MTIIAKMACWQDIVGVRCHAHELRGVRYGKISTYTVHTNSLQNMDRVCDIVGGLLPLAQVCLQLIARCVECVCLNPETAQVHSFHHDRGDGAALACTQVITIMLKPQCNAFGLFDNCHHSIRLRLLYA